MAIEAADVVSVERDPRDMAGVMALSRLTRRRMVESLLWATGYNVAAIPAAAGMLYHSGVVLSPAAGAMLVLLSTAIVAVNARLISYGKEERTGETAPPSR